MIGERGRELVKRFEGLRLEAYRCPADVWTIGYGRTHLVKEGDTCTEAEAEAFLTQDLAACESTLAYQVTAPLTESMRDALASFVFNLGGGKFRISTLRKKVNALDYAAVPEQLRRWDKATDPATGALIVLPGLTVRREAEATLFLMDGIPS